MTTPENVPSGLAQPMPQATSECAFKNEDGITAVVPLGDGEEVRCSAGTTPYTLRVRHPTMIAPRGMAGMVSDEPGRHGPAVVHTHELSARFAWPRP